MYAEGLAYTLANCAEQCCDIPDFSAEAPCNSCCTPLHNWWADTWQTRLTTRATTGIQHVWQQLAACVFMRVTWQHCTQLTCPISWTLLFLEQKVSTHSFVSNCHIACQPSPQANMVSAGVHHQPYAARYSIFSASIFCCHEMFSRWCHSSVCTSGSRICPCTCADNQRKRCCSCVALLHVTAANLQICPSHMDRYVSCMSGTLAHGRFTAYRSACCDICYTEAFSHLLVPAGIYYKCCCLQTQETPFNQPPSRLMQHNSHSHHTLSITQNQDPAAADPHRLPSAELSRQNAAVQQSGSASPELVESDSDCATPHSAEAIASQCSIDGNPMGAHQRHDSPATAAAVKPIRAYLETDLAAVNFAFKAESVQRSLKTQRDKLAAYTVPSSVLHKWGNVLDIVTPESLATNCFTKTYSQYAKVSRQADCSGAWQIV